MGRVPCGSTGYEVVGEITIAVSANALLGIVLLAVLMAVLAPVVIQIWHVRHLKKAAASIKVGDSRTHVADILGSPQTTYISGFPAGGGTPTVWGSCYGGPVNSCRAMIDHLVYRACRNSPTISPWYPAQHPKDWPVVLEFDRDGIVTTIKR
jgi:hypothetical protein